jgi:hypothetical protein
VNLSYSGALQLRPNFIDIRKFAPANDTVNGEPVDLHLDQLLQATAKHLQVSYRTA